MSDQIFRNYLDQFAIKLNPAFSMEKHVIENSIWEAASISVMSKVVQVGDTCLDIGANVGFHTLTLAKLSGDTGHVISFEPSSHAYPRLVDNVNLNSGLHERVYAEKMALSDTTGITPLYQDGTGGNSYLAGGGNTVATPAEDEEFEYCLMSTLDDYCYNETSKFPSPSAALRAVLASSPPAFLKIDVEGFELEVIKGASRLIEEEHPSLFYETHLGCFSHDKLRELEGSLLAKGYQLLRLNHQMKMQPARYPDYGADLLAVHSEKLSSFPELQKALT